MLDPTTASEIRSQLSSNRPGSHSSADSMHASYTDTAAEHHRRSSHSRPFIEITELPEELLSRTTNNSMMGTPHLPQGLDGFSLITEEGLSFLSTLLSELAEVKSQYIAFSQQPAGAQPPQHRTAYMEWLLSTMAELPIDEAVNMVGQQPPEARRRRHSTAPLDDDGVARSFQTDEGGAHAEQWAVLFTNYLKKTRSEDDGLKSINNYTILSEIGRGSFGKVKLAVIGDSNRRRAIKIVPKRKLRGNKLGKSDEELDGELMHEIAIMKKLKHKHVVRLYEVIDDPESEKLYMVMQYIERGPVVKVQGDGTCDPLDLEVARSYMKQIASAVEYLHSMSIAHHDIKPDNILIGSDGLAYLADFGVSSVFTGSNDQANSRGLKGTVAFMAPECFDNSVADSDAAASLDDRAMDVWALGCTFYCFLFGRMPFSPDVPYQELVESIKVDDIMYDRGADIENSFVSMDMLGGRANTWTGNAEESLDASLSTTTMGTSRGTDELLWNACVDLIRGMLERDPLRRFTISSVVHHHFFSRKRETSQAFNKLQSALNASHSVSIQDISQVMGASARSTRRSRSSSQNRRSQSPSVVGGSGSNARIESPRGSFSDPTNEGPMKSHTHGLIEIMKRESVHGEAIDNPSVSVSTPLTVAREQQKSANQRSAFSSNNDPLDSEGSGASGAKDFDIESLDSDTEEASPNEPPTPLNAKQSTDENSTDTVPPLASPKHVHAPKGAQSTSVGPTTSDEVATSQASAAEEQQKPPQKERPKPRVHQEDLKRAFSRVISRKSNQSTPPTVGNLNMSPTLPRPRSASKDNSVDSEASKGLPMSVSAGGSATESRDFPSVTSTGTQPPPGAAGGRRNTRVAIILPPSTPVTAGGAMPPEFGSPLTSPTNQQHH